LRAKVVSTLLLVTVLLVLSCLAVGCGKGKKLIGTWETVDGELTIKFEKGDRYSWYFTYLPGLFTWKVRGSTLIIKGPYGTERIPFELQGDNTLILHKVPFRERSIEKTIILFRVEEEEDE